jgi:hypothetical protein
VKKSAKNWSCLLSKIINSTWRKADMQWNVLGI